MSEGPPQGLVQAGGPPWLGMKPLWPQGSSHPRKERQCPSPLCAPASLLPGFGGRVRGGTPAGKATARDVTEPKRPEPGCPGRGRCPTVGGGGGGPSSTGHLSHPDAGLRAPGPSAPLCPGSEPHFMEAEAGPEEELHSQARQALNPCLRGRRAAPSVVPHQERGPGAVQLWAVRGQPSQDGACAGSRDLEHGGGGEWGPHGRPSPRVPSCRSYGHPVFKASSSVTSSLKPSAVTLPPGIQTRASED